MVFHCQGGVFVGVESYPRLNAEQFLPGASEDASQLFYYFSQIQPSLFWRCLVSSQRQLPNRRKLIALFVELVESIACNSFGVFYYAGHGVMDRGSLILTTADFVPKIPWDTGVPLARLFEIIRERAVKGSRFLFVLDCCRHGGGIFEADNVPQCVALVYACQEGYEAIEYENSGIFSKVLLESLAKAGHEGLTVTQIRSCGLDRLLKLCTEALPFYSHPGLSPPEVFGIPPESFEIPIAVGDPRNGAVEKRRPKCVFLGPVLETAEAGTQSLAIATALQSFGLRLGVTVANHENQIDSDKASVAVELLDGASAYTEIMVVEKLVTWCKRDIMGLRFVWTQPVGEDVILGAFRGLDNLSVVGASEQERGYYWSNKTGNSETRGQAWGMRLSSGTGCQITVQCVDRSNVALPLFYLLPSLLTVFQRMRSLE